MNPNQTGRPTAMGKWLRRWRVYRKKHWRRLTHVPRHNAIMSQKQAAMKAALTAFNPDIWTYTTHGMRAHDFTVKVH